MLKARRLNDAYFSLLLGRQEDMSNDYIHQPDKGILFPNKFKKSDSHPDYTGTYAMPDGTMREVAAWINDKGYLSLRFSDQYVATDKKTA